MCVFYFSAGKGVREGNKKEQNKKEKWKEKERIKEEIFKGNKWKCI